MTTNTYPRKHRHTLLAIVTAALVLAGCQNAPQDVAADFEECLTSHGVVAQNVEATLASDGTVGSLTLVILIEDGMPYEPVLRLACTAEVEGNA